MEDNVFGLYIAQRRTALGLSQKALADAVGVSRPYVTQIENGSRVPAEETMMRLLGALGIGMEDVMRDLAADKMDPREVQLLVGPMRAYDLMNRYMTQEQVAEVLAAFGSQEQIAAMAQLVVNEQPVAGGPDRWLELGKEDRRLVQRLVNRLADAKG